MTCYQELRELQAKAKPLGVLVTLYRDEQGNFDQVHIDGLKGRTGFRDPLSAAEFLRSVVARD